MWPLFSCILYQNAPSPFRDVQHDGYQYGDKSSLNGYIILRLLLSWSLGSKYFRSKVNQCVINKPFTVKVEVQIKLTRLSAKWHNMFILCLRFSYIASTRHQPRLGTNKLITKLSHSILSVYCTICHMSSRLCELADNSTRGDIPKAISFQRLFYFQF